MLGYIPVLYFILSVSKMSGFRETEASRGSVSAFRNRLARLRKSRIFSFWPGSDILGKAAPPRKKKRSEPGRITALAVAKVKGFEMYFAFHSVWSIRNFFCFLEYSKRKFS